jgi:hypothetical protein
VSLAVAIFSPRFEAALHEFKKYVETGPQSASIKQIGFTIPPNVARVDKLNS